MTCPTSPTGSRLDALPLFLVILVALLLLAGCGDEDGPDAYGNFEATEVTVSAEARGRLVQLAVNEGARLAEGEAVGLIDTTQLGSRRRSLAAQQRSLAQERLATLSQIPEIRARVEALRAQLETAEEELARTERLHADQAATARELNERRGEVRALRAQVQEAEARVATVRERAASRAASIEQVAAQIDEVRAQIADARIVNPTPGTVLTVTAERGESVQQGAPLYTVANLDTLRLRAYATGEQLPRLRLGMGVVVAADGEAGGLATRPGTVTWIADDAQFTPTPIQTRDERAELVYAFDVRVPNRDGLLKVGMPGEVRFRSSAPSPGDSTAPPDEDGRLPNPATANGR